MKRSILTALRAAVMVMAGSVFSFADDGLTLVSSYPVDGQKNMSMENLGVKLTFSNPINSDEAKKIDESKFRIVDEEGETVPIQVLFSDANDGLVLVVANSEDNNGFIAKNNCEYTLTIDAGLVDNDGNELAQAQTVTFRTYNQKVNNMVNMGMMFVMFGGIMVLTMRQNKQKEEDEADKKEEPKKAFNPYKEAQRTGKTVEEVKAEQAKREEKEAKKRARKKKKTETPAEKKIENCAEDLNNVYHVHAPAPVNKADRSVNALNEMRREEARAEKAAKAAAEAAKKKKKK